MLRSNFIKSVGKASQEAKYIIFVKDCKSKVLLTFFLISLKLERHNNRPPIYKTIIVTEDSLFIHFLFDYS